MGTNNFTNHKIITLSVCSGLLLSFSSCINNDYDLDNISKEITVAESGLSIPIGTTDYIHLSKLIGSDDNLKPNDDGIYEISKGGDTETSFSPISEVVMTNLTPDIDPIPISPITSPGYGKPFTVSAPLAITNDVTSDADVQDELKRMDYVTLEEARAQLKISVTGAGNLISKISMTGYKIKFPDVFVFKSGQGIDDNNQLTITGSADGSSFSRDITIIGLKNVPIRNGKVDLKQIFSMNGTMDVTINPAGGTGTYRPQINPEFIIPDITVKEVEGLADINLPVTEQTIEIGELPDFVTGDDVTLDLTNPSISATATNPVGIPALVAITLTPFDSNGEQIKDDKTGKPISVSVENIAIKEAASNNGISTPSTTKLLLTGNTENSGKEGYIYVADLPLLVKKIPATVKIYISGKSDTSKPHLIILGNNQNNNVSLDYNVNIPLEFGENMKIVYSDTEDDLGDTFESFSFKKAYIKINAENTLPLNLLFSITPLDAEGNVLSKINADVPKPIKGCANESVPEFTDLTVVLSDDSNSGELKKLNAIKWSVTADPKNVTQSGVLKSTQYIRLKMILKVTGGINLDIDEL